MVSKTNQPSQYRLIYSLTATGRSVPQPVRANLLDSIIFEDFDDGVQQ